MAKVSPLLYSSRTTYTEPFLSFDSPRKNNIETTILKGKHERRPKRTLFVLLDFV